MKKQGVLQSTLAVLVLVLLIGLAGCEPYAVEPQSGARVLSPPGTVASEPYPPPAKPEVTIVPTANEFGEIVYPSPTFPPSPTPWPTPTRRPGPTATPLPVPRPAQDAAGTIFYAVRTDAALPTGEVYRLSVDWNGNAIAAQPVESTRGFMRGYPSWDYSLMALIPHQRMVNRDSIFILNPKTGQATPVTASLEVGGRFLGWHPNNRDILYLAVEHLQGGLWLVNFETGEQTIVVTQYPAVYIQDAAMSPDGQRIAYINHLDVFSPSEMWMVNADGSNPRLLFSDTTSMFGLAWSPDGNKIAFEGRDGLNVMNADGTERKSVAHNFFVGEGFEPIWSPDSRYLAYVAYEPELVPPDIVQQGKERSVQDWDKEAFLGSNIHIVDISTGQERTLVSIKPTGQIEGNVDPAWSPDGKWIAFAALREGQAGLWVVNVDGIGLRQLATSPDLIRFPVWMR